MSNQNDDNVHTHTYILGKNKSCKIWKKSSNSNGHDMVLYGWKCENSSITHKIVESKWRWNMHNLCIVTTNPAKYWYHGVNPPICFAERTKHGFYIPSPFVASREGDSCRVLIINCLG